MRDVIFSDGPSSLPTPLQIEAALYQAQPMHGLDQKLRSVLRERRAFLTAFFIVLALGITYLIVAPRQYLAEATVMAAPRYPDLSRTDSVLNPTGQPEPVIVRDPDIEGEIQILDSPAALRRLVVDLHLDAVRPGEGGGGPSVSDLLQGLRGLIGLDTSATTQAAGARAWAALLARFGWGKAESPDPERQIELAVDQLGRKLKVAPIGRSTMIKVQYTASDPKLAALVATTAARNYIDTRFQDRRNAAAQAGAFLRQRTARLRQDVVDAEQRLAAYKAAAQSQGSDAAQLQNDMRVMGERIVAARAEMDKAVSRYAAAQDRVRESGPMGLLAWDSGPGPDEYLTNQRAISDMRKEAAKLSAVQGPLSANAGRLEAEAHTLEQKLLIEAQTRLGNLRMTADASQREVAALEASLQRMRDQYDRLNAASDQLSAYENAVLAARTVYQNFATRLATTEQAGFNEAAGWLVSPAGVPPVPAKPNVLLILLGTLVASIGCGVASAFHADYRGGRTIRTMEDIERHLPGTRYLGLLPELKGRTYRPRDIVAAAHSAIRPEISEAARSLYTAVHAVVDQDRRTIGGRVLAVTSAVPMEGKSSTTGALAAAAAASGERVLVIDCDLHSPVMHVTLGVEPLPGLADCLETGLSPREAVRTNPTLGVSVLPAGRPRGLPQRLLRSPRFVTLIAEMRCDFDLIILDTPPVIGLADTRIIARAADRTALAICWSRTRSLTARLALRNLVEAGAVLAGVVMTRVDVDRLAGFETPEAEPYRGAYRTHYRDYYRAPAAVEPPREKIAGPKP